MIDFGTYIQQSKRNCEELHGLDPTKAPELEVGISREEVQQRKQSLEQALHVIQHFMQKLLYYMGGTPTLVVTTDIDGYIVDIYGDPSIMEMVDSIGIQAGVKFEEKEVGTNSISLALRHKEPIALVGTDHFHHALSGVACYTAPFSYSDDNRLSGTVSIMTTIEYANHFHLGLLSSAVDSIERELRLQEKNDKLEILNQVLINSTPLGIMMTDEHGELIEYNTSLEQITESNVNQVLEKEHKQIDIIREYIDRVLHNGDTINNVEITLPINEEGDTKICLLDVIPLYNGEKIIGAFAQFRDMTHYYELQQQLIESEKLSTLGKFGAGLAHEIRNPLTSIIGLTQLLKENNNQNKYLDIIIGELERIQSLVNQFVLLRKPTDLKAETCNIPTLIQNTVELMNSNAQLQNIDIQFDSPHSDLKLDVDHAKIKQVLINFIKNAFESMPNGGKVRIQLIGTPKENEVRISIQDQGVGMTEDQVSKLGKPFFTTKESGMGMGLAICFDIIKAHQGDIKIESEKGEGTRVDLVLPKEA
ncbi:ATP-binding protein [Pontibacillus yanchengensis]|uniref:histidine kinase n=1 Tax=Pontibacillus yanchengensis Y32 TaxID=1385514 RepID=A0A0A2TYG0_9BACI|nr:ATP-binding protein [Pontibacillus yanchengensis]KGP74280.1 histidine kinase [Pontibacillus yanchengensis Y32]